MPLTGTSIPISQRSDATPLLQSFDLFHIIEYTKRFLDWDARSKSGSLPLSHGFHLDIIEHILGELRLSKVSELHSLSNADLFLKLNTYFLNSSLVEEIKLALRGDDREKKRSDYSTPCPLNSTRPSIRHL